MNPIKKNPGENKNVGVDYMSFVQKLSQQIIYRVVERQRTEQLQDVARRITTRRLQERRGAIDPDGDPYETMSKIFRKHTGKSIRVRMFADDSIVFDDVYEVPETGFNRWFKNVVYDFTNGGSDDFSLRTSGAQRARVVVSKGVKVDGKIFNQYFAEGATNCVLKPIKSWVQERLDNVKSSTTKSKWKTKLKKVDFFETKYPDGIPENAMHEICDYFNIDITIDLPLADEFLKWKYKSKALAHFKYLNTKLNHAEHLTDKGKIIEVSQEEINAVPENYEFYMYKRSKDGDYTRVLTIDGTYVVRDEYRDVIDAFEKQYDFTRYRIDHQKESSVSSFVRNGTHFNNTVIFKDYDDDVEIEHIDMTKAYSQFKKFSGYEGFLGKITDFRKCDRIVAIGVYRITNIRGLPDWLVEMGCYVDMNVYPSVELKWLKRVLGVDFDIVEGAWGTRFDFDFPQQMLDTKYYANWVGQAHQLNTEHKFYMRKTDIEYVENWASHTGSKIMEYDDEVCITYEKDSAPHMTHIAGFITAYQRLNLYEQLMKMDMSKIIRITTDDIYYESHEFEMNQIFKHKINKMPPGHPSPSFLSNIREFQIVVENQERDHYLKEAFKGAGGNGKTHYNMTDKGLVNVLYVAPSYKLCSAMKHYGKDVAVLYRLLDDDRFGLSRRYNTFIIDEMSMMTETQKEKIFEDFADCKLIFCGDPDCQLPPVSGEQMTMNGFDNVCEMKKNYRFTCDKHKELCLAVRKLMDSGDPNSFIFENYTHVKREDMVYDPTKDIILCSTNKFGDEWVEKYGKGKWRILENTRKCNNGDIVLGDEPEWKCEARHGFTIHSVQGETFDGTIFIDKRRWFDPTMGYTAISRARRYDQVKIIV